MIPMSAAMNARALRWLVGFAPLIASALTATALAQAPREKITIPVQWIYTGPGTNAFVPATADWCKDEVNIILHRPVFQGPEGYLRSSEMFGQAKLIVAAVRKRCPQMRTAIVHGTAGPLNALETNMFYEGKYEENPRVGYLVAEKGSKHFTGAEPERVYVLNKEHQAAVTAAKKNAKAEEERRLAGKYGPPNAADMQGYISQSMASMLGTTEIHGAEVTSRFLGQVMVRRTTVVDTTECTTRGEKYHCEIEIRRTSGPSIFQPKETPWATGRFSDTCSWASPGRLRCEDVEKVVAQMAAERVRSTRQSSGKRGADSYSEPFDFDKHQKNVYCNSFGGANMAAYQFGGC